VSGTATAGGLATTRTNNTTGANLASLTSPTGWNGPDRSTQEDGNGRLCAFGGGGTSYGVGRSNNTTGANLASLTSSPRGSTLSITYYLKAAALLLNMFPTPLTKCQNIQTEVLLLVSVDNNT